VIICLFPILLSLLFAGWADQAVTARAAGMSLFFIGDVRKTGSGFTPGHKPFDNVIKS